MPRECGLCAYLRWSLRGEALRRAGLLPGPPPPGPRWRGAARVPCGVYARVQGAMGESGQGCRGARAGPGVRRDPGGNSLSFFTDLGALRVDRCGRPLRIRRSIPVLTKVLFIRAAGGGDRQSSGADVRGKWCWGGCWGQCSCEQDGCGGAQGMGV